MAASQGERLQKQLGPNKQTNAQEHSSVDEMFINDSDQIVNPSSQTSIKSSQSVIEDLSQSLTQSTPELDDEYRDIENENREKFLLLQSFFSTLSNGELDIKYKWKEDKVSERVDRSRARLLDNMVHYLLETVFPEGDEVAYQNVIDRAFQTKPENSSSLVLEKIIEAYNSTKSKQIKKYLIMELTLVKKFKELQEILPGLTMYQYKSARRTVKESGLSKMPDEGYKSVTRNRRDYDSTVFFINFFSGFVRVSLKYMNFKQTLRINFFYRMLVTVPRMWY